MYLYYYKIFVDIHLNLLGYFFIGTYFARASMVEDVLDKVFEIKQFPINNGNGELKICKFYRFVNVVILMCSQHIELALMLPN